VQTIPSAIAALRANKRRSILTTLGIIIGVASVIAIVALGQGASASVSSRLAGLGTNLLTITPGSTQSAGAAAGAGSATSLKADDATAIGVKVDGLTGVSPVVSGSVQIIAGSQNWSTRVQAVTPAYLAQSQHIGWDGNNRAMWRFSQ
jgi:putative ABC transport system permease protein